MSFIYKYETSLNDTWFHKRGKGVAASYLYINDTLEYNPSYKIP